VLSALARALMLTADERDYLFRMAGESPPPTPVPSRAIAPGIRHLLDSLPETPAYVVDAAYNVLAWNNQLVTEMLALSPRFADMWQAYEVEVRGPMLKRVLHPQAGPLEFECQVLHVAGTGQRLIAYCAAPGSPTEAAFRQLAALLPA